MQTNVYSFAFQLHAYCKLICVFFFLFFFVSLTAYSQASTAETTIESNEESEQEPEETEEEEETVEQKLSDIEKALKIIQSKVSDVDEDEEVGTMILFKTKVKIFVEQDRKKARKNVSGGTDEQEVEIEKVLFNIKDGVIVDIQIITTDHRTFTNYYSPLRLNLFNESGHYATYLNTEGKIERLYLNRCLRWVRKHGFNPKDQYFEMNKDVTSYVLKRGVGINHIIDLNLFTDLPALFSNKANGVTQTEAYARIITNTSNIKRFVLGDGKIRSPIIPFKFFSVKASFAKFDSDYGTTVLDENFSRQELLQKATIYVDLTTNLISTWIPRKSPTWFNLNVGGGIYSSNLTVEQDTSNVIMPFMYVDPVFELRGASNFGMDLSFRFMFQRAPEVEDYEGWHQIFRPQITLFWHPSNSPANRVFARAVYFQDQKEQDESFFQLQMGYSLRLSDVIKKE